MSKPFKSIGVVAGVTMCSRVLGLGRDMLTTAVFGASGLNSAFVTAFTLPNLFRRLLGEGALTAALVPTLHEEMEKHGREGAFRVLNQVLAWLSVATGSIVLLAILVMSQVRGLEGWLQAHGVSEGAAQRWETGARLAMFLFPYLVFVCLAAAFSAALQTLERFFEPALSPVWLNLSMIGCLGGAVWLGWSEGDMGRMNWLCSGVLIGGFLQMLVPALVLRRYGWKPRVDFGRDAAVMQIARLMGPTVFGSAIYLVNMSVSRMIGLSLNEGAATVLNLAARLMELPIGVFAVAVSTVIFPLIARHAAKGDHSGLAASYRKGMRLILIINIPAAVGLSVIAEPIIRMLFQRGAFSASDTQSMTPVLAACAVGLPFVSFVNLALRAFYARKDTQTPVKAALWSFLVNLTASLVLMKSLSTLGLALAGTMGVMVQAFYLQHHLTRGHPGLAFSHLFSDTVKVALSSAVMGIVVWGSWRLWSGHVAHFWWRDPVGIFLVIAMAAVVYGSAIWMLRVEGRADLETLIKNKLRGRKVVAS